MRKPFALLLTLTLQAGAAAPTFYRDVLPILQNRCQSCHRPGEIAPMPLLTYADTRPWAAAIREVVRTRKMPPWFATDGSASFSNNPSLTQREIQILSDWGSAKAPSGSPADAPAPAQWKRGFQIGQPDLTLRMPRPFPVAANFVVEYQYLIFPDRFLTDRWVDAVEIRPGNRRVVHHAVLYTREAGNDWLRDAPVGEMFHPSQNAFTTSDILAVYTPGSGPSMTPKGMARKIPAGAQLILQIHYTALAKPAADQTVVGLRYTAAEPTHRVLTLQMGKDNLRILPFEANQRFTVSGTMPQAALLLSFLPHMHLRGSAFEYALAGKDGHWRTLLTVKPYDFFWQLQYILKEPVPLQAGTRLLWAGYFDNSRNNPRNPDPSAEVGWGEQSWQEMMIGFFDVAVDPMTDKAKLFVR